MTEEQVAEINRIHAAVDDFASDMKTRLTQKVEAGYTGWDGDYPSSKLRREVVSDAMTAWDTACDDKAVDIANRCMMLWRRRPKTRADTRAALKEWENAEKKSKKSR